MTVPSTRFQSIAEKYSKLRIAVVGDFCLDRYLEIDPEKREISIETGLPVHNVVNIRSQPGAAGTILNNLVALGVGEILVVSFCGEDGEGWELRRALQTKPNVRLDYFFATNERRTFTYTKPLLIQSGKAPVELNRLDVKNWNPTSAVVAECLSQAVARVAGIVDAIILMDQVDLPDTGVVTKPVLQEIERVAQARPELLIVADSRRGLKGFPKVVFKMNSAELARLVKTEATLDVDKIKRQAASLARQHGRPVFVTLSERGIVGAEPSEEAYHVPSFPPRGEIDIVGAGDAVTANLTTALAAKATVPEALELAMAAASIVIHQLGTTGTASIPQIQELLEAQRRPNLR